MLSPFASSSPALFLQRAALTSLSRYAAFILVRALIATGYRLLYISVDLNLTVAAIVRTRAPTVRFPACPCFPFFLLHNGTTRARRSGCHNITFAIIEGLTATMHRVVYVLHI